LAQIVVQAREKEEKIFSIFIRAQKRFAGGKSWYKREKKKRNIFIFSERRSDSLEANR
jgi:hypothetical protein